MEQYLILKQALIFKKGNPAKASYGQIALQLLGLSASNCGPQTAHLLSMSETPEGAWSFLHSEEQTFCQHFGFHKRESDEVWDQVT